MQEVAFLPCTSSLDCCDDAEIVDIPVRCCLRSVVRQARYCPKYVPATRVEEEEI